MKLYLKGVRMFQNSHLLQCQCLKPNPFTETDDLTGLPSSHNNWPGVLKKLAALLCILQTFLFTCTTECAVKDECLVQKCAPLPTFFIWFSALTLLKRVKDTGPLERDQGYSVMQPRGGCDGRISLCLWVWPFGTCKNTFDLKHALVPEQQKRLIAHNSQNDIDNLRR